MKLLKHLTLLCMLVALAAGCTKQAPPSLDLLTTSISLPCEGGTAEVSIKTNQNWTVSASQPWLTVMPGGGSASADYQTLTITATANEGEEKRQAEVTVTTGELSRMVSVSQAGTPRVTIPGLPRQAGEHDHVVQAHGRGRLAPGRALRQFLSH